MKWFTRCRTFNFLIVAFFLTATFLVLVFVLRSGGGTGSEPEEGAKADQSQESLEFGIKLERMVIRGWDGNLLKWLLEAPRAQLDRDVTRMYCEGGVLVSVFDGEGNLRSKISAGEAELDLVENVFRFKDQVEAQSTFGNRLFGEELTYYPDEGKITSQSLVKVLFDHNFIESKGLVSDIDFERPEFFEVISGRFQIGD